MTTFLLQPDEFKNLKSIYLKCHTSIKVEVLYSMTFCVVSGNNTKCLTFVLIMPRFEHNALWLQNNIAAGSINQYLRAY